MGVTLLKLTGRGLYIWIRDHAAEREDFTADWSARLAKGEEIKSASFELPVGDLVATDLSSKPTSATVRISGGTPGQAYELLNRVTTSTGRELQQAIRLRVKG